MRVLPGLRRRTIAECYWHDRVQDSDSVLGGGALVALVLLGLGFL